MTIYSFSQINLYEQCPKKYQYRYIDGLEKEFESSPDLILGTSVHGALERLYQQVNVFNTPIKADVLGKFHELRNNGIAEAGGSLIYKGDQHEEDYLRRGEHYLEEYYEKYSPFENIKLVATEANLVFSLDENPNSEENKFRGIIDRLDKDQDGKFVINDYKTNKNLPPEDKDEYREQLTLYAYGVKQKYGRYLTDIKARLYYLHFDLVDEWTVSEEDIKRVVEKYKGDIMKIEHARFEYNMGFNDAFPTKQNAYCKYCEYQNVCPLWQHLNYADETVSAGELGEQTIKRLVDRYKELSSKCSELSKEKDIIKELLIEYANNKGFQQLFGDTAKVGITKSDIYTTKDIDQFINFLEEKGILKESVEVPYYKLGSLVKDNKLSPDEIKKYLDRKDSWRLTASKK